jgi:serine/threonine-protein kinase
VSLAPPAHSPITAGYRLDRYELICPIAEGGMASVWIARQTGKHGFQKLVAVKTVLPKYAEDPAFQNMFIDEARIASRIEHANVTQILDVGEQHGVTYLVMEYVDGDALSKISRAARKKDVKIPLGILLRIVADVCGGLHAAHELKDERGSPLGVVHRDVSPQNVLVTTRGVAKLIDFGIAKARDRLSGDTNADTLKGKVQYMAPEQALGRAVDRRADVYAVGAVLYHLIAGRPPFEAENDIQTLFLVTSGRTPVPLSPAVPAPVRELVKRALVHSPEGRFATAAELQQAIEDAIVESRLAASPSNVAAFLAEMVGERAEKRKEAIALGLKAAEEREKVDAIMRSNADKTSVSSDSSKLLVSDIATSSAIFRPDSSPRSEPTTSATGQTLGSSAMAIPAETGSRGLRFAIVGGVVGASLAVLALVALTRGHATPAPTAARPPPPVATSIAPAAPPVVAAATATTSAGTASPSAPAPSTTASASATPDATAPPVAAQPPRAAAYPAIPAARPMSAPKPATVPTRVNDGF